MALFLPFLFVGLSVLAFVLTGLLIDFYVFHHRKNVSWNWPFFLGLGIGAIGLGQLLLSLFRVPLSQSAVLALFLVLGLPLVLDTSLVRLVKQKALSSRQKMSGLTAILGVSLGLFLVIIAGLTFDHTIWGSDAYVFWLAKASAFFKDGLVTQENLFVYWPYDHPLLWPLTAAWVYHFLGKVDEYYLQVIPLVLYVSLAVAFFQGLSGGAGRRVLWTVLLLLSPFVYHNVLAAEYAGNADLLVSFYLLLGVVFLVKREVWLGGLFLFFASFTKNDALPAAVGFLVLLPLFKGNFKRGWYWGWLGTAGLLVGHGLWRAHFGLSSRYVANISLALAQRSLVENIWYTANAFREELRQVSRWGLGWWLIFFTLVSRFKYLLKQPNLLLPVGVLLFQVVGYVVVYYVTPEDQASHIATSIHRLVLQLYPASLYLAAQLSYNGRQHADRY